MAHERVFITDAITLETAGVVNGGLDMNLQDQTSRVFGNHFSRVTGTQALETDWVADSYSMEIAGTPSGIIAGDYLIAYDQLALMELQVVSVTPDVPNNKDVLIVDTLASKTFEVANTVIYQVDFEMAVDGSAGGGGPFSFRFPAAVIDPPPIFLDVTQMRLNILDQSQMDDATFGGIPALTNGVIARHHRDDGINHLGTVKTNGQMAVLGSIEYADNAPAGFFGLRAVFRFAGQQNAGAVLRIETANYIEIIIQDDLTGLDSFQGIAIGHVGVP